MVVVLRRRFANRVLCTAILAAVVVASAAPPQSPHPAHKKTKPSQSETSKYEGKHHHKKKHKHKFFPFIGIHDPILTLVGSNSADGVSTTVGIATAQRLDIRRGVEFPQPSGQLKIDLKGTMYTIALHDPNASQSGDDCTVELLEYRSEDGKPHGDDGHGLWKKLDPVGNRAAVNRSQSTTLYPGDYTLFNFFVSDGHETTHQTVTHHEHLRVRVTYGSGSTAEVYDIDLNTPYVFVDDKQ
jgi:hypothetical protein